MPLITDRRSAANNSADRIRSCRQNMLLGGNPGQLDRAVHGPLQRLVRRGDLARWARERSEHVNRRELGGRISARPQVDRKAEVSGPKRVAVPTELLKVSLALLDGVHREATSALEPDRILGPVEELQERVSVAGGTMTQPGTIARNYFNFSSSFCSN